MHWHHGSTLPTWVPGKPPHSLRKEDVVGCSDLWASPSEPSSFSWPHAYGRGRPWQCIQGHFKLPWLPFLQRKEKQCPYPTPHPQSHATACRVRRHGVGFPGGAVVENLPANAGDTGSSPGLGRSHMPQSN